MATIWKNLKVCELKSPEVLKSIILKSPFMALAPIAKFRK
jgi:hypothetical protein